MNSEDPNTGPDNSELFDDAEDRRRTTETLVPQLYQELRKLAAYKIKNSSDSTLSGTALLHEAYLRLSRSQEEMPAWANKRHFFSAAAEAMRRVLLDRIRAKKRVKRGGEYHRDEFEEDHLPDPSNQFSLLAINEALDQLESVDPVAADVVKLRFFGGLSLEEIADSLELSLRTVNRRWAHARVVLSKELGDP